LPWPNFILHLYEQWVFSHEVYILAVGTPSVILTSDPNTFHPTPDLVIPEVGPPTVWVDAAGNTYNIYSDTEPEPATFVLAMTGVALVALRRRLLS
jgi:hypothetical protein